MRSDGSSLSGWQSGLLWSDWQPKPSYAVFAHTVAHINRGWVDCAARGRQLTRPNPAMP